ncbi:sulfurtransferase [Candidimonas sp. SYP-B2681]|uniref:VTT domain-containing protein n=1 Tax=Candidimonas sp. SYP-B2681 TaxID=2497686 RepID=UPI000F874CEB|nr:VTT domain-containing protein [Candidimonas sp. SYP-B2681]RTZ41150.1 sulfurtransferase [Candidimonas sp. SYP-B2681]
MQSILQLIEEHGLAVVFLNVLIEQAGAPIPAYPVLVISGALLDTSAYSALALLGVAVLGALLADFGWYLAGRRYGRKMLSTLCRISLSPDSCVKQTESIYLSWGPPSLMVAKFIPGFASIASVLAGAVGTKKRSFLLFDVIGAALWAGSAIFLGSLFSTAVDELLSVLVSLGLLGVLLLGAGLLLFIANKWWQRKRFIKSLCMERVTVEELHDLLQSGSQPIIVDVRSALAQAQGRIPGAISLTAGSIAMNAERISEVIVYCDCPNDASAAVVSKQLMQKGYGRVRPLAGGIEAGLDAGYSIEDEIDTLLAPEA